MGLKKSKGLINAARTGAVPGNVADAHPEWTLMYRKGLSRKEIAELAKVEFSAVAYHVAGAKALDADLRAEHRAAAAMVPATPGIKRLYQLLATVEARGRYPSRDAEDPAERELAQWLRRRRRDAEAGVLNRVIDEGLAVLPDWQRKPGEARREQKWQSRLQQLTAYRTAGRPWPRANSAVTELERDLGRWLSTQRHTLRQGELSPARSEALDAALPGWLEGRKGTAERPPSSDLL
jgi:hypothetical protein